MHKWILPFEDISRNDVAMAGGKGANLGELVGKGFPIPPGFVVSAGACRSFFEQIDLHEELAKLKTISSDGLNHHCHLIQEKIKAAGINNDLSTAILKAHAELMAKKGGAVPCAVRSSATAEDLGDASFAGQHATYYYVEEAQLISMIQHCWASLYHPEAVSYRATQGIDDQTVWMAVVVQEMVAADISGVTFTANPVNGSRDVVVTESSWGMGAAIVDGRVTPDHYVVNREDLHIREKRIADKQFMVPSSLTNGGDHRLKAVPQEKRLLETLSLELLETVSHWSVRAEDHFGSPQDVEWAIQGSEFFMLQSRPITVMGRDEIEAGVEGPHVIFKPLLENFTDPVTPLTADCYQFLFSPPMMKMIKGWLYVSLDIFRVIFPFKISNEALASFLYDFGKESPQLTLSWLKMPLLFVQALLSYLIFGVFFARTRGLPADFMDRYRQLAQQVASNPDCGISATQKRLLWWSRLFDPAGNQVMFVNLSSLRYFLSLGILENLLKKWLPDLREGAASLLCSGTKDVLSAEMGRGIWNLAKAVKEAPRLKAVFEAGKPEDIKTALETIPEAAHFHSLLKHFLANNGHRGLKELELRSLRWEEDPTPVLGMIRNYMLVENDPDEHEKNVQRTREDLEDEIRKGLAHRIGESALHLRWRLIQQLVKTTKYFSRIRENSRFYHTLGFYVVRKKILELEKDFLEKGKLRCYGDIFYLYLNEVGLLQQGQLSWSEVEERIRERRMMHIRLSKTDPPKTINVELEGFSEVKPDPQDHPGDTYKGQPASPGSFEGTARVILDPSIDAELKPGEILVAPYTDPAWTPLFLTAGAAVVEIGSFLSHAGTVAREFGMPCVVDLPGCTRIIQSGNRLHVDGDKGVVTIIDQGSRIQGAKGPSEALWYKV